jgi:hypothetical protein
MRNARFRTNDDYRIDLTKIDDLTIDPVWDGMSLADFQRFGRYFRTVADTLGLREWTLYFRLTPEIPGDGEDQQTAPLAVIRVAPEGRFASVRLCQGFSDEHHDLQQEALIHECLHIYFEPMLHTLTEEILPEALGAQAASVITAYLGTDKERTIDALAVALSPLMPKLPKT